MLVRSYQTRFKEQFSHDGKKTIKNLKKNVSQYYSCVCGMCQHCNEKECIDIECFCCKNFHVRSGFKGGDHVFE